MYAIVVRDQHNQFIIRVSLSLETMSLARLAFKNLQYRVASSPLSASLSCPRFSERTVNPAQKQIWGGSEFLRRISSEAGEECPGDKQVAVSHGDKKSKLFPRSKQGRSLCRREHDVFSPALSGLGNALVQATKIINRLLGKLSPSRFLGRVKEQDYCYKLLYNVPGLTKDDVKVMVADGVLIIKGSRMEEETKESDDDDDNWPGLNYLGYYDASIMLPEDAKVDGKKAEMKNGVLTIIIPRAEMGKKHVIEIPVR